MNLQSYRGIGLMSGTSHDGLDIADVVFTESGIDWSFNIQSTKKFDFPESFTPFLTRLRSLTAIELKAFEIDFSKFSVECIRTVAGEHTEQIDFIASHGLTVFHSPSDGYSHQIGSGATIASLTGIQTICDFRQQDVSKGGNGAPLVPYADKELFKEYDATLNLGGFANIALVTSNIGYDIGPCNLLLNYLANKMGHPFDENGKLASSGKMIPKLYAELNKLEYYQLTAPKSLGAEWLDETILPILSRYQNSSIEDLIRTATEHVAFVITSSLNFSGSCLVTGGGAHNEFLMRLISESSEAKVVRPDTQVVDFKEAVDFAFLGLLRLLERTNISGTQTGATKDSCAGAIYLP